MQTDIYCELYAWNKNVDSLLCVLQRMQALRILQGQSLKEYEIRIEEVRSILNITILETILTREQTDYWRLHLRREGLDAAGRDNLVQ